MTCSASAHRSSARIRHKERNILDHLPERDRAGVRRQLRAAWAERDHAWALDRLEQLAGELERSHPGAAASLREGMAETLTLTRLGITGPLTRTLASTNPIESMIECVRRTSRNVKRWQSGEMALRWTAAGMLAAERQFRRIIGYQQPIPSSAIARPSGRRLLGGHLISKATFAAKSPDSTFITSSQRLSHESRLRLGG